MNKSARITIPLAVCLITICLVANAQVDLTGIKKRDEQGNLRNSNAVSATDADYVKGEIIVCFKDSTLNSNSIRNKVGDIVNLTLSDFLKNGKLKFTLDSFNIIKARPLVAY